MLKGAALFACTLAIGLVALPAAQGGAAVQRTVYVTAVDEKGAYVTDLGAADLSVREAGAERSLVRVEPSRTRLKVAVVVEELLVPDDEVRKGLAGFIDRLREDGELALYVAGRRLEKRVDYSTEAIPFARAINAFPARGVYQANLVEALMEASKDQGRIEGRRAVVAVANQTAQLSNVTADGVMEQMRRARQAFYAATLVAFDTAGPPTDATSGGRKQAGAREPGCGPGAGPVVQRRDQGIWRPAPVGGAARRHPRRARAHRVRSAEPVCGELRCSGGNPVGWPGDDCAGSARTDHPRTEPAS